MGLSNLLKFASKFNYLVAQVGKFKTTNFKNNKEVEFSVNYELDLESLKKAIELLSSGNLFYTAEELNNFTDFKQKAYYVEKYSTSQLGYDLARTLLTLGNLIYDFIGETKNLYSTKINEPVSIIEKNKIINKYLPEFKKMLENLINIEFLANMGDHVNFNTSDFSES